MWKSYFLGFLNTEFLQVNKIWFLYLKKSKFENPVEIPYSKFLQKKTSHIYIFFQNDYISSQNNEKIVKEPTNPNKIDNEFLENKENNPNLDTKVAVNISNNPVAQRETDRVDSPLTPTQNIVVF